MMKQANLKELKCGDVVCTECRGEPHGYYRFIGLNAEGNAVVENYAGFYNTPSVFLGGILYIPPVKKVLWVNLYNDNTFTAFFEQNQADCHAYCDGTATYRIGGKAFRIEYEE